jgi:DNA-binding HxlR family transcriptional regulator
VSVYRGISAPTGEVEDADSVSLSAWASPLGELRRIFPEASTKMLIQHLREMEKDGLVIRKDLSSRLRHVEYFLSDPLGFAVVELIGTLTRWGREYFPYEPNTPE